MLCSGQSVTRSIREQDPLKQGLKHSRLTFLPYLKIIREQDPLKQGLKRHFQILL